MIHELKQKRSTTHSVMIADQFQEPLHACAESYAKASFQRHKRIACFAHIFILVICLLSQATIASKDTNTPGVAVLLVDTDRIAGKVEAGIYGQFLEHINHSVEGLFAEQIQGRGKCGR